MVWIVRQIKRGLIGAILVVAAITLPAMATTYTSPSFTINGSTGTNSSQPDASSPSYTLANTTTGTPIGGGKSGSYTLLAGPQSGVVEDGAESTATSMQVSVQPTGLLAYYPLDDGSGAVAKDFSGNGYDATTASGSAADWTTGQLGGALAPFGQDGSGNGYSDKRFMTSEQTGFNSSYITICVWDNKSDGATGNPALVTRSDGSFSSTGMWSIGYGNGRKARFDVNATGTQVRTDANTTTSVNEWHLLCGSYDGTTARVYVDGQLDAQQTIGGGALPSISQPLTIGARSNGSSISKLDTIDDIKLFGRVLSDAEIKALYDAGVDGVASGLVFSTLIAGAPQQVGFNTVVRTDGTAYNLAISEDHDLQLDASTTIPGIAGTITTPTAWNTGVTKGLGFSITSAPNAPAKWGSGDNYAAIPTSATTFYGRSGSTAGTSETIATRLKLDVSASQPMGQYKNTITITATTTP